MLRDERRYIIKGARCGRISSRKKIMLCSVHILPIFRYISALSSVTCLVELSFFLFHPSVSVDG